jgi:RimJ/RimL family protein N-acetyltransferase
MRMAGPRYASLYQINTRVRLGELSRALGRPATLDDIGDAEIDRLAALGFDWIWLLSVWQTGPAAQRISRSHAPWRREFKQTLPDLRESDIAGSGFAISAYTVHAELGGDAALARLRARLQQRGLRLMLDFVPNHVAPDHPWVNEHPAFFVPGSHAELAHAPQNWCRVPTRNGPLLLAHGRDPYFDGWPDTLQLNYAKAQLQQAMIGELQRIAGQCDGVRCDMAMLVVPEVFERTWGLRSQPFWPKAIAAVRYQWPDFCFMAEVYWDMEAALQQQGFDTTYDKRLYDRLRQGQAQPVREQLQAALDYQARLVRFLENHDEPRAAASFAPEVHAAAAVLSYCVPGLRLFHQGQLEGFRVRISPHLRRGPDEAVDGRVAMFYARLLAALRHPALRDGLWCLLDCAPAWPGNPSHGQFIAGCWQVPGQPWLCMVVNYAPQAGQCFVPLPFAEAAPGPQRLRDLLGDAVYDRQGDDLQMRGLYLDLPPWGHHLFEVLPVEAWHGTSPAGGGMRQDGKMQPMNDATPSFQFSRPARLRNGTPVLIRAIRHDDRERIVAAFRKLDAETIYTRFFSAKKELSEADLSRIDRSDFVHAAVLVATLGSGADEIIIGGGAYTVIDKADGVPTAEVSFTIEEDYQGQGLSTLFMALLIEIGRERGIRRFEAEVLAGNTPMVKVFQHSGLPMTKQVEDGVVHVVMDLGTPVPKHP